MRFEATAAVSLKRTVFRDITPCSPVEAYRRFGGTYCLHLHGEVEQAGRKQSYVLDADHSLDLLFDLKDKLLRDYTASLIRRLYASPCTVYCLESRLCLKGFGN
jgi:hypothetical protein